ncbi:hypothetical protein [Calothrix sp. 336/3]|uniref:hypothetical protein n=1 Tax=Calothrix sp. 336/3 TaxID=1337936 RepID=UPI0004E2AF49|nr:hypothetical protein [Calothrix sp. 336/3]AKG22739.1 hypothetical protein IJ00_16960 [Calothrix sp. 336/3]
MTLRLKAMTSLLVLFATATFLPSVAVADTETSNYETTSDVFERAFYKNDPNFYGNTSSRRDLNLILGTGSRLRSGFPEHEIARDAELVNTLYRDIMHQQATYDPYIRTPDLPNPYTSSVLMSPRMNANKLKTGTEFRFDDMSNR